MTEKNMNARTPRMTKIFARTLSAGLPLLFRADNLDVDVDEVLTFTIFACVERGLGFSFAKK